mmetsp:Transcript_11938/g.27685  ORF Transcript_11938/g.27685 Transcript_11938/m.27685 type:complete len:284 (+) Transcript_11938:35-886(+)
MRLTAELIASSEQRTNPLGEREIILRGLAIPVIEHLGVTRDAFDAMDLTDNRLSRLENFPRLMRLSSLCLSGNVIQTVDANNMSKNLPNLKHLDISHNHISTLLEVSNLGKAYTIDSDDKQSENNSKKGMLEVLNLQGRQHYRLYTIQSIPSLKVLDHQRITQTERDRARRLAGSAAGAALESDIQDEAGNQNTFTPGEGASAEESFVVNFTAEEKEQIRLLVANAESPEEIEEIERSVQRGVLPKQIIKKPMPEEKNGSDENNSNKRKRSVEETTNGEGGKN